MILLTGCRTIRRHPEEKMATAQKKNTTEEETESATTTINTEKETTSTSIYSYVDENGEIQTRTVTVDNAKSEQETQAENSLETAPSPSETTAVTKNTTQTQAKTTEATKATQNEQNGTNNGQENPNNPDGDEWQWREQQQFNSPMAEQNDMEDSADIVLLANEKETTTKTTKTTTATTQSTKATTVTTQTTSNTGTTIKKKAVSMTKPSENYNGSTSIDHFSCYLDKYGILDNLDGTTDYTTEEVQYIVDYVLASEKQDGYYENLQYYQSEMKSGIYIVFTDCTAAKLMLRNILWISIGMFLVMEIVAFFLTIFLTRRAMQPIHETFEWQRQFISDAGHELKTPLTIISANVDILNDEIGENKWLSYIHAQTERMRVLINEMMNLTKLEMDNPIKDFKQFSLSNAVSSAALSFKSQAFEQNKKLEVNIQEGLIYSDNIDQIKQLVAIFIDNAIKYSDEKGKIRVTLSQTKDKKTLKIYNTEKGVTEEEKERIFERFYRSDSSRTRNTGGYGLGLSIAQGIADTHKIKIQVESEYGKWICFILTF